MRIVFIPTPARRLAGRARLCTTCYDQSLPHRVIGVSDGSIPVFPWSCRELGALSCRLFGRCSDAARDPRCRGPRPAGNARRGHRCSYRRPLARLQLHRHRQPRHGQDDPLGRRTRQERPSPRCGAAHRAGHLLCRHHPRRRARIRPRRICRARHQQHPAQRRLRPHSGRRPVLRRRDRTLLLHLADARPHLRPVHQHYPAARPHHP